MLLDELIAALRGECHNVTECLGECPEEAFVRRTRCPEWNAKELLGHVYRAVDRIDVYLSEPAPTAATHDGVTYFRSFDPLPGSTSSLGVAVRGREEAAAFPTARALVEAWNGRWPAVLERSATTDPARLVMTFGPTIRFDEYLRTRVLEVTVHGLDLADGLDIEPWATAAGRSVTAGILRGLAGEPDDGPDGVPWESIAVIEAATGRAALSEETRRALGSRASTFPLIG